MNKLRERSTRELMLVIITVTLCVLTLGAGFTIMVVHIAHPDLDVSWEEKSLAAVVAALLSVVVGYAGAHGVKKALKDDAELEP